ncbi:VanZ family protein [Halobacillus rhizosphaerae]|uniref:VanZ family protein n=1 Tax=Halobacillus rhizosphaerae TaxID=3064889 RepID=UPI00398AC59C
MSQKTFINIIYSLSLLFIMRFTIYPTAGGEVKPNIIPFAEIMYILLHYPFQSIIINILGNIALFVPLGFTLPLRFPIRNTTRQVVLMGMVFSLTVECIQTMLPGRMPDIDDIMLNTFGAFLGYQLYTYMRKQVGG